ncbi:putative ADP,ATP carrier protein 2, mitochondrial precursor [Kockovaella imperatae]|uniref:ADP/ATP translocase n=1 Tax=Kockovaella imperatae TaxID=4999 RepID=A0A1Y1UJC3_9TREE|nr:putative ADP,ATP carrier protein 2, mitochondrial precursor [Kockovaella imperatae]ORX38079.1 putative ADP,ATP carrier protein 2, mitochondrial precursor [Kockovaella imperatae]
MSKASTAEGTGSEWLTNFLMGGVAASISKTVGAPIERVKLLVQIRPQEYKGIITTFGKVYSEEGLASFWRGNGTNVLRYFPTQALNFAFKDYYKTFFGRKRSDGYVPFLLGNIASGAAAGATGSLFVYSLDYARTRLSVDSKNASSGGKRQFDGLIDVYKKTLKTDGVAGLYRGFNSSVMGIIVYRGGYFGLYDSIKPLVPAGYQNPAVNFCIGYGVTTLAGLAAYPFDTIRRRMMMTSAAEGVNTVKYKNTLDAFRKVIAAEGASSMFRGAGANILRGFAGAGALTLYDVFQQLMFGKVYQAGSG